MSGEKLNITVIEDDEDTRALLEFILNRAGFTVSRSGQRRRRPWYCWIS